MPTTIHMPKLGHTMSEGKVLCWHKQPGESVSEGETILTIETDKTEVEVESPAAGIMGAHAAHEGETVAVGGPLVTLFSSGEPSPSGDDSRSGSSPIPSPAVGVPAPKPTQAAHRTLASPRARRLAAEHGIHIGGIAGHGADGAVTESDVRAAIDARKDSPQVASASSNAEISRTAGALVPARRERLTRIQQIGARNLVSTWQSVPHFVQMVRVDMSRALGARRAFNAAGSHLSVTDLILYAAARALTNNPRINAAYAEGEMLIYDRINLGVAVDTPEGLVVPVVHDAHLMTLAKLSAHVSRLAEKARAKKLAPAELESATFTVSNLGAFGVENGTPVIFGSQSALMFVGAIREEVLAIDGHMEVRPAMQIAIAYDHRGIDGATAAHFTTEVKQRLESADFPDVPRATSAPTFAKHEVCVRLSTDGLRSEIRHGPFAWINSAEPGEGPDPVTAFMGALGSCLLMSLRVAARARNFDLAGASLSGRCTESGHVRTIDLELQISSAENDGKLDRLVEIAERGCHIRALIRDDVKVNLKVMRV